MLIFTCLSTAAPAPVQNIQHFPPEISPDLKTSTKNGLRKKKIRFTHRTDHDNLLLQGVVIRT